MAPIYSRGRGTRMAAKARQKGKAILGPGPRKWLQKKRRLPESFSGLTRGGLTARSQTTAYQHHRSSIHTYLKHRGTTSRENKVATLPKDRRLHVGTTSHPH